jgi:Oxidoreductase-like protein, N-terminal
MSGCAICVYDLYEESISAYDVSVVQVRKALAEMGVKEQDWPASILPTSSGTVVQRTAQATARDAFEEMERALQKKKEAREASARETKATVSSISSSTPPLPPPSVQATVPLSS